MTKSLFPLVLLLCQLLGRESGTGGGGDNKPGSSKRVGELSWGSERAPEVRRGFPEWRGVWPQ